MKIARHTPRLAAAVPLSVLTLLSASFLAGPVFAQTTTGSVVVKKFYDANANGIRDTGEPWLSGWPMTLTGPGIDSTRNSTATWTGLASGAV